MTSFTIIGLVNRSQTLLSGEIGSVLTSGALMTSTTALTVVGAGSFSNFGGMNSTIGATVNLIGEGAAIRNFGTMTFSGLGGDGSGAGVIASSIFNVPLVQAVTIQNSGLIRAVGEVADAINLATGGATITNSGTIQSFEGRAIHVQDLGGGGAGTLIVNSGTIAGAASGAVAAIQIVNDDADTVQNTGRIIGDVSLGGGNDVLISSGSIAGHVFMGAGNDRVVNTGTIGHTGGIDGPLLMDLGDGNDTLDALGATDLMFVSGGRGDDLYIVGAQRVVIREGRSGGNDTVIAHADIELGRSEQVETITLVGSALRAVGSNSANTITGTDRDNHLDGRGGADLLLGGGGHDVALGGDGNDSLQGGTGNDSLQGEAGDDRMDGQDGDDLLSGGAGNDFLIGGIGNDILFGGDGDEFMFGAAGNDMNDGGAGNDVIRSGFGNDTITGGDGNDIIEGGPGQDLLTGGLGADRFDFVSLAESGTALAARDTITDFTRGEDLLFLRGLGLTTATSGTGTVKEEFTGVAGELIFVAGAGAGAGGGLVLADANGDRIADFAVELLGVTALSAADLLL